MRSMLPRLPAWLQRTATPQSVAAGALSGDAASRILPWATALMAFLAALALAAALAVGEAAERWSAGFGGGLTVQIGPLPAEGADPLDRIHEMLRATPGVGQIDAMPPETVDRLLAPWLGGLVDLEGLPKPASWMSRWRPAPASTPLFWKPGSGPPTRTRRSTIMRSGRSGWLAMRPPSSGRRWSPPF